ncbi:hypothetical protein IIA29_01990 [candidate division KSB1 bacterium]|nr:hypothetical protein [candidate division KSB1 bacterium]
MFVRSLNIHSDVWDGCAKRLVARLTAVPHKGKLPAYHHRAGVRVITKHPTKPEAKILNVIIKFALGVAGQEVQTEQEILRGDISGAEECDKKAQADTDIFDFHDFLLLSSLTAKKQR